MNNRQLYIITLLMGVALLGLIGLQVYLLEKAVKVSEENFNSSVNEALNAVASQLYQSEVNSTMHSVSQALNIDLRQEILASQYNEQTQEEQLIFRWQGQSRLEVQEQAGGYSIRDTSQSVLELPNQDPTHLDPAYSELPMPEQLQAAQESERLMQVFSQTILNIRSQNFRVEDRLDSVQVDTLLRKALDARGIDIDFDFLIQQTSPQQTLLKSGESSQAMLTDSEHHVWLFTEMSNVAPSRLMTYFPAQQTFTWRAVWASAGASLLFISLILLCFGISIMVILRQKKLSEIKNDFINNMTHELKTPIATISLASDALKNPQVQQNPEQQNRYLDIIKEENKRMHTQVELVLQAARFARKEIQLKRETVDVHILIQDILSALKLQLEAREAQVIVDLRAHSPILQGDSIHLQNIIRNLLDNAIKYSEGIPRIHIQTRQHADTLFLRVADKGVGIHKNDQKRIFERFYRVPTGNLHDIKGFGLGLSYVRDIVEAHSGTIRLNSKLGKGSTFEVVLPIR